MFDYHIFPFPEKQVFEGVISYLNKCCGQNPHDKGYICASGTSCNELHYHAKNVADFQTNSWFHSQNEKNQWLCYDFKDMRVAITHYILRSPEASVGWYHLRSWVMEGSLDNEKWIELDCRREEQRLNGSKFVCSCEVRTVVESRFIRIRSIGADWGGQNFLMIQAFEVFGGLRVPDSAKLK
jgi:hypothetical protein